MSQLPIQEAIPRFKANEERVDNFVNESGYYDSHGVFIPSLSAVINDLKAFNDRGAWVTATSYVVKDLVLQSGTWYVCVVAHTAGVFATDLAAVKWIVYQGVTSNQLALDSSTAGMGYKQFGTEAVAYTVQKRLRLVKTFQDFGVVADGSQSYADMYAGCLKAWNSAMLYEHDLYAPAGLYAIGDFNFPWKNTEFPTTTLLDCKNITIYGDGPNSLFSTNSTNGADVFNLNGVKNLHIRNVGITATIAGGATSGSNGISVTNGFDNLTLLDIYMENLPRVDVGHPDGGKALSIQPGISPAEWGVMKARIIAKGCAIGFDADADLVASMTRKQAVEVDVIAENCYKAVSYSAGGAASALTEGMTTGISVRGKAVNCQQDVVLSRAHGYDVNIEIVTNKTAAARRLAPDSTAWNSTDSLVAGLICTYARNSQIKVFGNKGACDYKAKIGGASAGSAGLTGGGSTAYSDIYLDIGGTAATADVFEVDFGGNSLYKSNLFITPTTTTTISVGFYHLAKFNTVTIGPDQRPINLKVGGEINFSWPSGNGFDTFHKIKIFNGELSIQQFASSGVDGPIVSFLDHTGAKKMHVRNDGRIASAGKVAAASVGTLGNVWPIYDASNTLIGYIPIYNTFA